MSGRILETETFKVKDEAERRVWKNSHINLEYSKDQNRRCAFVHGPGTVTKMVFKDTDDMLAEVRELERESLQVGMVLDIHFQD
jgi:hypothetical protein